MNKVTCKNGVATFSGATQKRLAKAAKAVGMDAEGFIEHALDEAMRAAIESAHDDKKPEAASEAELYAASRKAAARSRAAELKLSRAKGRAAYLMAEAKSAAKLARSRVAR